MRIKGIVNHQTGSAAVLALIGLAIGGLLAATFLSLAGTSLHVSARYDEAADRAYAAEAGMEWAVWGLQTRSVSGLALPMTDTGMTINGCPVEVTISEVTDFVDPVFFLPEEQPRNKKVYQITSVATSGSPSITTSITSDVAIAYDIWDYAVLSLDGNITINGTRGWALFCLGADSADPYIRSVHPVLPAINEADMWANNGAVTVNRLRANVHPLIRGDVIANNAITDPFNYISGNKTPNALGTMPGLEEQLEQIDTAIVDWKHEAEFDEPEIITPLIFAPVTSMGSPPACLLPPIALANSPGAASVCMNGGTIQNVSWTYGGTVCFDSSLTINALLGVTEVNFDDSVSIDGDLTIGAALGGTTVNFNGSVFIDGDLTIGTAGALIITHFFENASSTNTVHITGDLNINSAVGGNTFISDIPVRVDGSVNLNAGAALIAATFGDDDLDTTWIGSGMDGGNLSMGVVLGGMAATFNGPVRIESGATLDGDIDTGGGLSAITATFNQSVHADGKLDAWGMFGATTLVFGDDPDQDRFWFGDFTRLAYALLAGGSTTFNGPFFSDGLVTLGGAGIAVGDLIFNDTFYCTGAVTTSGFFGGNTLRFGDTTTLGNITNFAESGDDSLIVTTAGAHGLSAPNNIDNIGDTGDGTITVATDEGHGLSAGETVEIAGTLLGYNGYYMVLSTPTLSTFTVSATFAGNDTGWIPGDEIKIEGTDNYDGVYTVLDTPSVDTFEVAATFEETETSGGNIDDYDSFYCGGTLTVNGLIAAAALSWQDRAYVGGDILLSGFLAGATCTFPDKVYCEGRVSVTNMFANAGVTFGDTLYIEGNLAASTAWLSSARITFDDITYVEGTVNFSGFLAWGNFTVGRMLISENNIVLTSENTANPVITTADIPLIISSGSATGIGDITISGYYDTPGIFYAPTGTILMNGDDNDIYGSMIGRIVTITDGPCTIFNTNNGLLFPQDIRQRAADLPGRSYGGGSVDILSWKIEES